MCASTITFLCGGHGSPVTGVTGRTEDVKKYSVCGVLVVTSMLSKVKADQRGSLPQCGPWGAAPPGAPGVGLVLKLVFQGRRL